MKQSLSRLLATLLWICGLINASAATEKEFLTDKEIATIQDNQDIQLRVKYYLEFAEARLKAAEDRLNGVESVAGDPFEFFTPEQMLDGYYRILRSVMLNLDGAYQNSDLRVRLKLHPALKILKKSSERALERLDILEKIAEEKKKEELWNLVNKAIDITKGAHEGAELGLSKEPAPSKNK